MARLIVAFALITCTALSFGVPGASADSGADFAVPSGHFYSQTNGTSHGLSGGGFVISDSSGVPFWTFFQQVGGVETLGYPISQRFVWDGYVCQATQRGIMQWNAATKVVQLVNVFDYLSLTGKDPWLASARLAPPAQRTPEEMSGQPLPFVLLAHYRFRWLYADPAIFHRYFTTPNYYAVFGLPTSPVVDLGAYYAVRFQRAVIYHWKTSMPWTDSAQTSVGLSGDIFRELGDIPLGALKPEPPNTVIANLPVFASSPQVTAITSPIQHTVEIPVAAAPAVRPLRLVNATYTAPNSVSGVATWYGADFQGRLMADGEVYNMYDPLFAASNIYPLGSYVRVTRVTTGQSIVVKVTDHGAFRYPNVLDMSYAAFSQLADPSSGVIGVRVELVTSPN